jgi:hypothetical protein
LGFGSLDTSLHDQFFEFVRRFKQFPGELERVTTAPWQEVVVETTSICST